VRHFTVHPFLTVKRRTVPAVVSLRGGGPHAPRLRSGGFDTGAAAVRLSAIGRPFQVARISPMEPPRGVPVSNPPRPGRLPEVSTAPRLCLSRQPTGARGQPGVSGSGSPAEPSESAARAARRGRLDRGAGLRPRRCGRALVFASSTGTPLRHSNFRRRIWLPALAAVGLKGVHLHDLRQTSSLPTRARTSGNLWSGRATTVSVPR